MKKKIVKRIIKILVKNNFSLNPIIVCCSIPQLVCNLIAKTWLQYQNHILCWISIILLERNRILDWNISSIFIRSVILQTAVLFFFSESATKLNNYSAYDNFPKHLNSIYFLKSFYKSIPRKYSQYTWEILKYLLFFSLLLFSPDSLEVPKEKNLLKAMS